MASMSKDCRIRIETEATEEADGQQLTGSLKNLAN